jgi:hypothetical protein
MTTSKYRGLSLVRREQQCGAGGADRCGLSKRARIGTDQYSEVGRVTGKVGIPERVIGWRKVFIDGLV